MFFSFSIHQVFAQAVIPSVLLAGRTVKDIISEFERTGGRLMQDARGTGNALISKFGNELNLATQNLNYYFGQNIDRLYYDKIKPEEQILLSELNRLIEAINNGVNTVTTLSELTNLDLIELTNRISLLTKKIDYYISSVHGTTVTNSPADYKIVVTGIGFGFSTSQKDFETSVYVNNILLPITSIDFTQRRQMVVSIPSGYLKEIFDDRKIQYAEIKIKAKISQSKRKGFIIWKTETAIQKFETKFNLTLMPKIAGYIVIGESITNQVLSKKIDTQFVTRSFTNCKTKNPCVYNEEWTCPENQRIFKVDYSCTGSLCSWSYPLHPNVKGRAVDYELSNNNKTVTLYRYIDGGPAVIKHSIYLRTFTNTYRNIIRDTIYLSYGEPLDVFLEEKNIEGNFTINGRLNTGQVISCNNNTIRSNKYLLLEGIGKEAGKFKTTFRLKDPF